ncbi:hypothetical protein [Ruegeria halocynthiae]|uniref:hypothetical protein n=1 Tax=Ruegeria halocynthiae TaxID=985054 RepID=UPI001160045D|nr:hypothetical protein [Ruegeria halocynthiae]
MLVYTLDDPYIHLAVAEEILRGNFGVNPNEPASPSSSILYPVLLSALMAIGFGDMAPLLLNIIGACVTAWIVAGVFWSTTVVPKSRLQVAFAIFLLPLLLLALNLIALPMVGMEHTLHVLASVCVVLAMYQLDRGQSPSALLLSCILWAPLLRFEGLAIALPALVALLIARRFGAFTVLTFALIAAFSAYVLIMQSFGLPALPSSVLVKSSISEAAYDRGSFEAISRLVYSTLDSLRNPRGVQIGLALGLLIMSLSYQRPANGGHWLTVGVASTAIAGHIVMGQYGWFSRYEVYVLAISIVALLLVWGEALLSVRKRSFFKFASIAVFLAVIAGPYAFTTLRTPHASENIFAQQYQMHRFATDYFPRPVAVNDLGYVSYENDVHVLDLWGLGSEVARKMNAGGERSADALIALTTEEGSVYAMIYGDWFAGDIPNTWCQMATLHTPQVTAALGEVDFYLIDSEYEPEFLQALQSFAESLPKVSSLSIQSCEGTVDLNSD